MPAGAQGIGYSKRQTQRLISRLASGPFDLKTGRGLAKIMQAHQQRQPKTHMLSRQAKPVRQLGVVYLAVLQQGQGNRRDIQHMAQQAVPLRLAAFGPQGAARTRQIVKRQHTRTVLESGSIHVK